jgi:hypothetical protein
VALDDLPRERGSKAGARISSLGWRRLNIPTMRRDPDAVVGHCEPPVGADLMADTVISGRTPRATNFSAFRQQVEEHPNEL